MCDSTVKLTKIERDAKGIMDRRVQRRVECALAELGELGVRLGMFSGDHARDYLDAINSIQHDLRAAHGTLSTFTFPKYSLAYFVDEESEVEASEGQGEVHGDSLLDALAAERDAGACCAEQVTEPRTLEAAPRG